MEKKKGKRKRARRRKQIRQTRRLLIACLALAVVLAATILLVKYFQANAVIGGKVYSRALETIDLRGRSLTGAGGIGRLVNLREALLSGNRLKDVSPLKSLARCEYIDLTDNPVSDESYAALRAALPDCLILCEAKDETTWQMALGGHPLPDRAALERVFASHEALTVVDLRGAGLTAQDEEALRRRFPDIGFLTEAASALSFSVASADAAASALALIPAGSQVRLTGCAFAPEEYRALAARFPDIALGANISLDGLPVPTDASEIDLEDRTVDAGLEDALGLFSDLEKLSVGEATPAQALGLKEALGLSEINYSYSGQRLDAQTAEVDLTGAADLGADALAALLETQPQLETVRLDAPDEAMVSVINAHRGQVHFDYKVTAFGKTFSALDRVIDFGNHKFQDGDVDDLMALIARMPDLTDVYMYESTLGKKSMDRLFDGWPDVFFGWTIKMCNNKYTIRTDDTAFSTDLGWPTHTYTQKDFWPLRYCKKLQALDLGHNAITDISFLVYFPHLKFLILADNRFSDITPLASLKELEYLEIFMCYDVRDYSPLAELPLKDLNMRSPWISPWKDGRKKRTFTADPFISIKTLERFWATRALFPREEEKRLREALPDCKFSITDETSTGNGWRQNGYYPTIKRMFKTGRYEELPRASGKAAASRKTLYTAESADVYAGASTASTRLTTLARGSKVYGVAIEGDFVRVEDASGSRAAYILTSQLSSSKPAGK